tara:strand:+ start:297 stop:1601 length:1305 start_codon:yes stop_codon:yes gene_type:complete
MNKEIKNIKKYSEFKMIDHLKHLFPLCRSITGNGIRASLRYFEKYHSEYKRLKFKTGEKIFDWEVPEEWDIKDAYLEHVETKQKFAEFKKNNLHVVNYSAPINELINLKDFSHKIYSLKKHPDWIPYVTSYYKKDWGFCLEESTKRIMPNGLYKVFINSSFKCGKLELSHALIRGKKKKEILFSTYLCHPSMANNELSGPVLINKILEYLKENYKTRNYSYRFIMQPETIGSIAYLSKYYKGLKNNIICGFNLSCVGDNRNYSYIHTPDEDTLADYAISSALIGLPNIKEFKFLDRGSDERQYCSPNINLPICTFSRTKFGEYPEYHTSADNLNIVSQEGLEGSFEVFKNIIDAIETTLYPKAKIPCEPQLGKRNLYPNLSNMNSSEINEVKLRMDFLAYCNGKRSIFEICKIIKYNLKDVLNEAKLLKNNNLI